MFSLTFYFFIMATLAFVASSRRSLFMKTGGHGVDFRYLPIHQAKSSENFPRIVQIAGIYPQVKPEDIFAPPPSLPVKKGKIHIKYHSSL